MPAATLLGSSARLVLGAHWQPAQPKQQASGPARDPISEKMVEMIKENTSCPPLAAASHVPAFLCTPPPHYIKTPCTNTAHICYMIKCTFKRKLSVWLLENSSLHKQLALHFYSVYCWRKFKRQFTAVFNCFRREAVVHFLKLPSSDVLILSMWLGF